MVSNLRFHHSVVFCFSSRSLSKAEVSDDALDRRREYAATRSRSCYRRLDDGIRRRAVAAIWRAAYPMAFRTVNGVKAGERVNKWISAALAYSYD